MCKNGPKGTHRTKAESQYAKTFWRQYDNLDRVITGDKTWVYQCSPETKRQMEPIPYDQKKIPSVQIKNQNNVADFFVLGLFITNLYRLDSQPSLLF
jgi:hypothetical protein